MIGTDRFGRGVGGWSGTGLATSRARQHLTPWVRLGTWLSYTLGALAIGLASMGVHAGMAGHPPPRSGRPQVPQDSYRVEAFSGALIFGMIGGALLVGAYLLRHIVRQQARLAWTAGTQSVLPPTTWADLPDPLDNKPPAPAAAALPTCLVPPDPLQRLRILVVTELHRTKGRRVPAESVLYGLLSGPILLAGAVFAVLWATTSDAGLRFLLAELAVAGLVIGVELGIAAVSPVRRARKLLALRARL